MKRTIIVCMALVALATVRGAGDQAAMTIELIPLGSIEPSVSDHLRKNLTEVFYADVSVSRAQPVPESAYNPTRRQYDSSVILRELAKRAGAHRQGILAIIDKDLYAQGLNFVFGEANASRGVAIIALPRLRQSYYGLPDDRKLFLSRALKEAVHEIGHLVNIGHCQDPACVMHFSNTLADTDRKDYRFCEKCRALLPKAPR
jgi:archaemetzincin